MILFFDSILWLLDRLNLGSLAVLLHHLFWSFATYWCLSIKSEINVLLFYFTLPLK